MSTDMTPTNTDDNSLNLWELLEILKSSWYWCVGGATLGLAGALGFLLVAPAKYEATGLIQSARVAGNDVESPAQLLERLKFPTFYTDAVIKACDVDSANPQATLAASVKPTIVKGNPLIQMTYRAESPEAARACLDTVFDQVSASQSVLVEPRLQNAEQQLALTKQQLDDAEKFQALIDKRALTMDVSDANFSQSMVLMSAALNKKEEIARLRKSVAEQTTQLIEPFTQETRLLEPMYVPERPVFPKKIVTAAGGLVGGLVLGGLVFFMRKSWLRHKAA